MALFAMTLPFSDAVFLQAFPRECTEAFQEGHRRAFEFFGAAATRISYDNSRVAITKITGTAYERHSLIVTTNLPFENWTEVLGSERLTGAALDRLTHRCHILETKGESYRLKDARRRRRSNDKQ